jgi:hypothetical protein
MFIVDGAERFGWKDEIIGLIATLQSPLIAEKTAPKKGLFSVSAQTHPMPGTMINGEELVTKIPHSG